VAQTDGRTLQQIRRDTERARAGLTDTVDQLRTSVTETASDIRQRISPDAIKAEVGDYVRSRGERLLADAKSAARRNPMQAVAVGASLAYPLFRLARSIPAPILMVGAGLFLAGSKQGQALTQKASDAASDFADEARRRADDLQDSVGETVAAARDFSADKISELTDTVSARASQLREASASAGATVSSAADEFRRHAATASDAIRAAASDGQDQVRTAAGTVADKASGLASNARDSLDAGMENVQQTAGSVRQRTAELADRASHGFMDVVEQNPLLVAGIGLVIGGLIAGALPRSDFEDGLVGDASGDVKNRVRDAASKGVAAAREMATGVYEDVAQQAQQQGLTPDRLAEAVTDLGQRVRRVTEAAVTTAFDPDQTDSPKADGGNAHG
jgi:ElaB/YqjD/DUF883 family membrane-anchored ribosome-binding protein